MSYNVGNNIVTSGLVLSLDVSNKKCFRGDATTNHFNSYVNSCPTFGNSWGTYNVNQYNAGNFFSIGTVSAVTGNEVTMSGAHPLRTYDVVRPQTTGGGLTANTDYYIKKTSSTTFTIHNYDGTQDCSKGFSVLDPINSNTRVSINATNFPTMWWGYPHLGNSGLIKTIVKNGFNGHDCIRCHWYRPDGVTDGMAYGAESYHVSGTLYTYSFWYRGADTNAVGKTVTWNTHNWGAGYGTGLGVTNAITQNWQKLTTQWVAPANGNACYYFFPSAGPCTVDISEIMVESKSYASSMFTGTTRGTTVATGGGLYDLSGNNNHWEIVGEVTGSANCVILNGGFLTSPAISVTQYRTVDIVYQLIDTNKWGPLFRINDWKERIFPNLIQLISTSGSYYNLNGPDSSTNIINIAYSLNGNVATSYKNGVLQTQVTMDSPVNTGDGFIYDSGWQCAGAECGASRMKIYSLRFYNRALSGTEILQNYNTHKRRFGL